MFSRPTNSLPIEQRRRLHADFLANEQTYARLRDQLLQMHQGQWVAVHDGSVIAAGKDLLAVTAAAAATGGHPFVALVGAESEAIFRVRRAVFSSSN